MNKYATLYGLSLQRQLEVRSDFLFERTRAISILISMYFLWTAMLSNRTNLFGYHRDQLLTYVFMMTLLRAWVLACVTDRIPMEISRGKLSEILLRPISHLGYWATQDAANKSLSIGSAVVELAVFLMIVRSPFVVPRDPRVWLAFLSTTVAAMVLYFQMSYLLGVLGFWTAQSWGPRFCFEILLEFCAGAYFPIDLLPRAAQKALSFLPFPYLIYYPLSIYLGRLSLAAAVGCLVRQLAWIGGLAIGVKLAWRGGLRYYAGEGA